MLEINKIHCGDVNQLMMELDNESIDMYITSPPYWGLRDYGIKGQIGLEEHPNQYIKKMVSIFHLLKKALKKTGSFYLNIGDTYCSTGNKENDENYPDAKNINAVHRGRIKERSNWLQPKQLMLMPSRLAIALQEDGWILRNDIIWHKPNPMPSSVKDRLNTTFEHIFHFVKSKKYYYDLDSIREEHITPQKERESFNYRVRESKKGHFGIIGVKSTPEEMAQYDTKGKHGVIKTIRHHGSGLGDVLDYGKYNDKKTEQKHRQGFDRERVKAAGGSQGVCNPLGKNPGDFWSITTQPFPEAHFAVFPTTILIKPIKSSVPNEVCVKCGEPRFPIVETGELVPDAPGYKPRGHKGDNKLVNRWNSGEEKYGPNMHYERKTIGYTKCSCNSGFKPALVLDPFMGSGTVAYVCKYAGKFGIKKKINFIGFELNQQYVDMANKRLAQGLLPDFLENIVS